MTEAAWAWVDHLRGGGTTPWLEFRDQPARGTRSVDQQGGGRLLPGAQQLELLRRLNLSGLNQSGADKTLVERVLEASAPGRGRSDLELVGAVPPLAFGPRPVDPAALPAEQLTRVAAGLLAEDVVATGLRPAPARKPRRILSRRRYRLVGDPWLADPLRAALAASGRPPGGSGALVVVAGTDVATMLGHVWATRCLRDGAVAWDDFLAGVRGSGRLPHRIDLGTVADDWAEKVGSGRVRVVLDPARIAPALGVRRGPGVRADLPADATELARRVGGALGHLAAPVRRAELLDLVLLPRLQRDAVGPAVVVPPRHRDWVDRQAQRLRQQLAQRGYPVEGDPDLLLPRWLDDMDGVNDAPDRVLDLALGLLLRPVGGPPEAAS